MKQIRNLVPFGPRSANASVNGGHKQGPVSVVNTGAGYERGYKVVKPSGPPSTGGFSRNDGKSK